MTSPLLIKVFLRAVTLTFVQVQAAVGRTVDSSGGARLRQTSRHKEVINYWVFI